MGRTGRRDGTTANTTFLCENPEAVLQAVALIELAREGWVERVTDQQRCWPVLVHQLLALTLQFGAISAERCWEQLSRVPDFRGISRAEFDGVVEHMKREDFLFESGGLLSMGEKAERKFGRKNFLELYAVFSSPVLYRVQTNAGRDLGSLEQSFVDRLVEDMSSFLLGGRAWTVERVSHEDRVVFVRDAPGGVKPSWGGFIPQHLGFELCQRMKGVLTEAIRYPYVDEPGWHHIEEKRGDLGDLLRRPGAAVQIDDEREAIAVAVSYHVDADLATLRQRLSSRDQRIRAEAIAALRTSMANARSALAPGLERVGARTTSVGESMPFVTVGIVGRAALWELANLDGVISLLANPRATQVLLGVPGSTPGNGSFPTGMSDSRAASVFNVQGKLYGLGQSIGLIESRGTSFFFQHDAFTYTAPLVNPEHEPYHCNVQSDPAQAPGTPKPYAAEVCYVAGNAGLWNPAAGGPAGVYNLGNSEICISDSVHADQVCLEDHSNAVLTSMVTSAQDLYPNPMVVPHGAVQSLFYFANQGAVWETGAGESVTNPDGTPGAVGDKWENVTSVGCDITNVDHAFTWMWKNGVTLVNESFACTSYDPEGIPEDHYARYFGMTVFKSAGNSGGKTVCKSFNSVCVGNSTYNGCSIDSTSSWQNPTGSDREEPDVTAYGVAVDAVDLAKELQPGSLYPSIIPTTCDEAHGVVGCCGANSQFGTGVRWLCVGGTLAGLSCPDKCGWDALNGGGAYDCSPTAPHDPTLTYPQACVPVNPVHDYSTVGGTSFSSPVLTAFSALLGENCGGPMTDYRLRSILRTSAWVHNPDGGAYSTPGTGDGKDGAGAPTADSASVFCSALLSPGEQAPQAIAKDVLLDPSAATQVPQVVAVSGPVPGNPLIYVLPRIGSSLGTFALQAGDRFRATLSWDACPSSGPGKATFATDFDVALCSETACIGRSHSWDDNNEGFDIEVPTSGQYTMWWYTVLNLGQPQEMLCDGKPEPATFTAAWGHPSTFSSFINTDECL